MAPLIDPRVIPRSNSRTKRLGVRLATLNSHTDRIRGARELRDGRILSWSYDRTLRLWTRLGHPDGPPLTGHTDAIAGVLELTDGRILSWSTPGDRPINERSIDRTLRLWTGSGKPCGGPLTGHTSWVSGAIELRDKRILSWSWYELRLWTTAGHPDGPPLSRPGGILGARELRDGRILSWGADGTLQIWAATGIPDGPPLAVHTAWIYGVFELSTGGILSWSRHELRLWMTAGPTQGRAMAGHTDRIRGALELRDGRNLVLE